MKVGSEDGSEVEVEIEVEVEVEAEVEVLRRLLDCCVNVKMLMMMKKNSLNDG